MDAPGTYDGSIAIDLRASVLDWLKRALQGQVPSSACAYSFACDPVARTVTLKAEFEREPSRAERDDIETIESDV